jgi:hypothetical protein
MTAPVAGAGEGGPSKPTVLVGLLSTCCESFKRTFSDPERMVQADVRGIVGFAPSGLCEPTWVKM